MNIKFSVLCLFMSLALLACTRSDDQSDPNRVEIALTPIFENSARATATAFEVGDQIGLYVLRSIENEKITATISGALESERTLYYPDPKDPASLRAYYPYNSSVTDPTKFSFAVSEDLKQSDLCYAQAEALPSKEAQALPFKHILSRVVLDIALNSKIDNITSVKFINTATDLTLNIETGAITLGSQTNSLAVNSSEAIIPPQTFAAGAKMLEITVETKAGAAEVYYYSPLTATTLEQGKSHSFSLALRDNQTTELTSPPLIAPWTSVSTTGTVGQKVKNSFTAHSMIAHYRFAEVNRMVLSVEDGITGVVADFEAVNLALVGGSSLGMASYTFELAPSALNYPYTIQSVKLYKAAELIQEAATAASTIIGSNVYKNGAFTIALKLLPAISLSSPSPGAVTIPRGGATYSTNVISNTNWSAGSLENVTVSPSSGVGGTTLVTITVDKNTVTASRSASVAFDTSIGGTHPASTAKWSGTQGPHMTISVSPIGDWSGVGYDGEARDVTVTTAGTDSWTASTESLTNGGLRLSKSSGKSGDKVTISWLPQYDKAVARSGKVVFETNPAGESVTILTAQQAGIVGTRPINPAVGDVWGGLMYAGIASNNKQLWIDHNGGGDPGIAWGPNDVVFGGLDWHDGYKNTLELVSRGGGKYLAAEYCHSKGMFLPSILQLQMLYSLDRNNFAKGDFAIISKSNYGIWYWTSGENSAPYALFIRFDKEFGSNQAIPGGKTSHLSVRCVREF